MLLMISEFYVQDMSFQFPRKVTNFLSLSNSVLRFIHSPIHSFIRDSFLNYCISVLFLRVFQGIHSSCHPIASFKVTEGVHPHLSDHASLSYQYNILFVICFDFWAVFSLLSYSEMV